MIKIAIFVEGQTEQIFVSKLIMEMCSRGGAAIETRQLSGGSGERKTIILKSDPQTSSARFYVLINDCHGDSSVKSDIIEQFPSLVKQSYTYIIGIRDLYPLTDANRLKAGLCANLPQKEGVFTSIFLAIAEVESWLIAEDKHYKRISPLLTMDLVNSIAGIDVSRDSTESIPHPAETLHRIYSKVGKAYKKSALQVQRTVNALYFEHLRTGVRERVKSLKAFLDCLDSIFSK
jgi:hypothetical protein